MDDSRGQGPEGRSMRACLPAADTGEKRRRL